MSDEEDDYCTEEEEEDDEEEEKPEEEIVAGPVCEICGQHTDSIFECYVKREYRGKLEMVKIYLCAVHFKSRIDLDSTPPPPPDDEGDALDLLREFLEHFGEDDDEEDDEDGNGGGIRKKCNVDRENQSFG